MHREANAFAPPTVQEDFALQCIVRGEAMTALARAESSRMPGEIAGFCRRMEATGPWVPLPVLIAAAPPGGPVEQAVLHGFLDEMRAGSPPRCRWMASMPQATAQAARPATRTATGRSPPWCTGLSDPGCQ